MPGKVYYQELEDWNRNAAFYEQQNESPFQQILLEQMTQTYGLSDCGGMLLDLGGGVGSFASRLDGAGTVALCVDFSMEMLLAARRRNPRIRCLCASADSLPFRESSFAAAVCNGTLHHVKVQDLLPEAVKELVRVLRPGATLCIQDRHNGAMSNLAEAALGSLKTMHRFLGDSSSCSTRNECSLSEEDLNLFMQRGFTIKRRKYIFPVPAKLLAICANIMLYILGPSRSHQFQKRFLGLARFLESRLSPRWLSTEQLIRMELERKD